MADAELLKNISPLEKRLSICSPTLKIDQPISSKTYDHESNDSRLNGFSLNLPNKIVCQVELDPDGTPSSSTLLSELPSNYLLSECKENDIELSNALHLLHCDLTIRNGIQFINSGHNDEYSNGLEIDQFFINKNYDENCVKPENLFETNFENPNEIKAENEINFDIDNNLLDLLQIAVEDNSFETSENTPINKDLQIEANSNKVSLSDLANEHFSNLALQENDINLKNFPPFENDNLKDKETSNIDLDNFLFSISSDKIDDNVDNFPTDCLNFNGCDFDINGCDFNQFNNETSKESLNIIDDKNTQFLNFISSVGQSENCSLNKVSANEDCNLANLIDFSKLTNPSNINTHKDSDNVDGLKQVNSVSLDKEVNANYENFETNIDLSACIKKKLPNNCGTQHCSETIYFNDIDKVLSEYNNYNYHDNDILCENKLSDKYKNKKLKSSLLLRTLACKPKINTVLKQKILDFQIEILKNRRETLQVNKPLDWDLVKEADQSIFAHCKGRFVFDPQSN